MVVAPAARLHETAQGLEGQPGPVGAVGGLVMDLVTRLIQLEGGEQARVKLAMQRQKFIATGETRAAVVSRQSAEKAERNLFEPDQDPIQFL